MTTQHGVSIINTEAIFHQYRHRAREALQRVQEVGSIEGLERLQEAFHTLAVLNYTTILYDPEGRPILQPVRWDELARLLDQASTMLSAQLNHRRSLRDEPITDDTKPCWIASLATGGLSIEGINEIARISDGFGPRVSSRTDQGVGYSLFREHQDAADFIALCYQNVQGLYGGALILEFGTFSDYKTS